MRLALGLILFTSLTAFAAPQNSVLEEARSDLDRADYRKALDKINKVVFASSEMPPADRFDVLMMKGECQLQLKDRLGASSTFKSAAKAAGNLDDYALAYASALIIDRSPMGVFTPAYGSGGKPIDITPADMRKQAMVALQRQIWGKAQGDIDAALRANALPPIEKAFNGMVDAYLLERAATGDAKETEKPMRELGAHAYRLLRAEINRAAWRVQQFGMLANSCDDDGDRRGLKVVEERELRDMLPYLARLCERARDYRSAAARLGGDEQKWDTLAADAADALAAGQSLANER